jgi:TPP-dependent pyruvate/acetoin dehydrogenase alpha subunit
MEVNQFKYASIKSDLGDLADPLKFRDNLSIHQQDADKLIHQLEKMLLIRAVEENIAELVLQNSVKCPCHLGVGQEAIAVGIAQHLNSEDRAFGNHRSHNHYLAMGGSIDGLFAEIFGKKTGCSKGMGGSMHIYAGEAGFHGAVPIVAGTIPIAVGAALSAKLSGSKAVGVAFFGDGACEEGVVHESLNFAAVMKLPMIFVVENNLYSSHMDIFLRQPSDLTARFAAAHHVDYRVVDGNDVTAVDKAAAELITRAREGGGPGFLEAITYRWLGHVGGNADIDVGVRRSLEELESWKKRDPLSRLFKALETHQLYSKEQLIAAQERIDKVVKSSIKKAEDAPWPHPDDLYKYVYRSKSMS